MNVSGVYSAAFRLSANLSLAEEITREAFLTTWRQISQIRDDTPFSSWVIGITVYSTLEKFRSGKYKDIFGKGIKSTEIPYSADNDDILILEKAVLSLPDIDRFVLILHDFQKYTEVEVADMLFIKAEEVKDKLISARQSLSNAGGLENISLPIEERIKQLPANIIPPVDLWNDIFKQIHIINENADIQPQPEYRTGKKGILSWFKKNK